MSDDPATTTQTVGASLPEWGSLKVLEEIGRGGFGVVYRAWEPALAREVALKIIRPREEHGPEALAAILREGQLLARVRHPNVVTVHGAMQIGDEVGLWMEFVRGRSLSSLVKEDGPRAAAEAAVIGISVCQAMAAVHQAGVIHRDIKANNVMREAGGRIVLMDFGAGQVLDGPRAPDERTVGTPAYMAPEVLAGGKASARSDIYSVGVLLYYLVSGTYPVEGQTWTDFLLAHARFERRPLADVRPDVPARFIRVVERATALRPDDRYGSPGAMLADLTATASGGAVVQRRATRTDSRRRKVEEKKATSPALRIAAIVGGVVLAIWALGAITTIAFNHTLGRGAEYTNESVFRWWVWGGRALLSGAVYSIIVMLLVSLVTAVWKVVRRVWAPAGKLGKELTARRSSFASRTGIGDADVAAQALLAAQIVAVGAFCWYFRDIFAAISTFVAEASAQETAPLRPEQLEYHRLYNFTMAMLILAMSYFGYRIMLMRRRANLPLRSGAMSGIAAVIVVALVVLVLPYRLIWHNRFERVTYQAERCYILGERATTSLLYCPDGAVPKVKEVALPAEGLQRSGVLESIYTR